MCGIAGFIDHTNRFDWHDCLAEMTGALTHRGPDASGIWFDPQEGVALGHRRLSIVDLSAGGSQPMRSACGRYVIVFNGEVYNHGEIRSELETVCGASSWRGHSDTEVILAAVASWGVEAAIKRFVGMFAIALWDGRERLLHLVRDRIGEKPLYYGFMGETFLFASELKALRAHPAWRGEIDRDALCLYLRHNYIPSPYSIHRGIRKLLPGTILTLKLGPGWLSSAQPMQPIPYWRLQDCAASGEKAPFAGSEAEAVDRLDELLRDAVSHQMMADVPLGAFLSGGVDSSAIVALMQAQSPRPVRTFTIGFDEKGYNEAHHAKEVARHLGTDHTELYVRPTDTLSVIPRLPELYDEPFADASQIPTFLVSQLTRQHVTVGLSGDGGDELFAGYNRYLWVRRIWNKIGWIPRWMRGAAASSLLAIDPDTWDSLFRNAATLLPSRFDLRTPGDKLHKLAGVLDVKDARDMYYRLVSHWGDPAQVVLGGREPLTALTAGSAGGDLRDFTQTMMALDTLTYLPDDILVKVDRAAMGESLETRVPFLDHRVIEFAWRLPMSMKIKHGQSKWILRQVLNRYVPQSLIDRPKAGFGIPIDSWLRGPLRDWCEDLLDEKHLKEEGFFDPGPIRKRWLEHQSGHRNWQYHLWSILMFQCWLRHQKQ